MCFPQYRTHGKAYITQRSIILPYIRSLEVYYCLLIWWHVLLLKLKTLMHSFNKITIVPLSHTSFNFLLLCYSLLPFQLLFNVFRFSIFILYVYSYMLCAFQPCIQPSREEALGNFPYLSFSHPSMQSKAQLHLSLMGPSSCLIQAGQEGRCWEKREREPSHNQFIIFIESPPLGKLQSALLSPHYTEV